MSKRALYLVARQACVKSKYIQSLLSNVLLTQSLQLSGSADSAENLVGRMSHLGRVETKQYKLQE